MAHDVNQCEMDIAAQVRSALVERISSERFELWIAPNTQWLWDNGLLSLQFEDAYTCQLAKKMIGAELADVARQIAGPDAKLQFLTSPAAKQPSVVNPPSPATDNGIQKVSINFKPAELHETASKVEHSTKERFHWNRFIQGDCNQMGWAAANMIVSEPGRLTPVLLHGPCGVGKTHISMAIAEFLRTQGRMRRVAYMTSEQFTNDFTEAIKSSGLPMFRRKYRDVEALLIDDIHFFIGKRATIGELKHTLDNLLRLGKQVVFTSDRSINDLHALGSDVVGRLRGGLVSPLMPIDNSTRSQLMEREIAQANIKVPTEVVRHIASKTVGDGRVLQGIVKRLMAVASLHGNSLSPEQCWLAVYDLIQSTQPVVRLADIERVVCEVFHLPPESLQSSSKMRSVAQPRMLAMYLARKYTPAAYKEIGDYFGNRRHSTVISAERTVEGWLRDNSNLGEVRGLPVKDAIRQVESNLQVG
jgi:chromosomal replication initiator protein